MRIVVFALLLLSLSTTIQAQPGYQGKKLSFGYNIYLSPAWESGNYSGSKAIYSYNTTHQAKVDYVVGRKSSLGLMYTFSRTSIDYSLEIFPGTNLYEGTNAIKIHSHGGGIYTRSYFSKPGNLAPVGRYVEFDFQIFDNVLTDKLVNEKVNRFQNGQIGISIGKQRVYFKNILFDLALRFAAVSPSISSSGIIQVYDQNLKDEAHKRLVKQHLLNIRLGIGFLAD